MQRRTSVGGFKTSRIYTSVSSSLIGIVIVLLCLLLFSFIMTKFDAPEPMVSVMSSLALCIGAYSGGYIASKKRRQNGLLIGVITGIIIYCVVFFAGVFFAKSSITFSFLSKMIMTLICAAVGGVIGVNSRGKRY